MGVRARPGLITVIIAGVGSIEIIVIIVTIKIAIIIIIICGVGSTGPCFVPVFLAVITKRSVSSFEALAVSVPPVVAEAASDVH